MWFFHVRWHSILWCVCATLATQITLGEKFHLFLPENTSNRWHEDANLDQASCLAWYNLAMQTQKGPSHEEKNSSFENCRWGLSPWMWEARASTQWTNCGKPWIPSIQWGSHVVLVGPSPFGYTKQDMVTPIDSTSLLITWPILVSKYKWPHHNY